MKQKSKLENEFTTIAISRLNYLLLRKMGGTGESFNDVLSRIIEKEKITIAKESECGAHLVYSDSGSEIRGADSS